MKVIRILIAALAFGLVVPAHAEEKDDLVSQFLVETGQLRIALGQTQQALAKEKARAAALQSELDGLKSKK